jgi:hypothetical protein
MAKFAVAYPKMFKYAMSIPGAWSIQEFIQKVEHRWEQISEELRATQYLHISCYRRDEAEELTFALETECPDINFRTIHVDDDVVAREDKRLALLRKKNE